MCVCHHHAQRRLAKEGAASIAKRYKMPEKIAEPFHTRIDMLLKRGCACIMHTSLLLTHTHL